MMLIILVLHRSLSVSMSMGLWRIQCDLLYRTCHSWVPGIWEAQEQIRWNPGLFRLQGRTQFICSPRRLGDERRSILDWSSLESRKPLEVRSPVLGWSQWMTLSRAEVSQENLCGEVSGRGDGTVPPRPLPHLQGLISWNTLLPWIEVTTPSWFYQAFALTPKMCSRSHGWNLCVVLKALSQSTTPLERPPPWMTVLPNINYTHNSENIFPVAEYSSKS